MNKEEKRKKLKEKNWFRCDRTNNNIHNELWSKPTNNNIWYPLLSLEHAFKRMIKRMPKYPEINVKLIGEDGNAMSIIGIVSKALRNGEVDKSEINEFTNEAMSGNYNNVLQTCMRWVSVE